MCKICEIKIQNVVGHNHPPFMYGKTFQLLTFLQTCVNPLVVLYPPIKLFPHQIFYRKWKILMWEMCDE